MCDLCLEYEDVQQRAWAAALAHPEAIRDFQAALLAFFDAEDQS